MGIAHLRNEVDRSLLVRYFNLHLRHELLVAPTAAADLGDVTHVVWMDCHRHKKSHHEQRARGELAKGFETAAPARHALRQEQARPPAPADGAGAGARPN